MPAGAGHTPASPANVVPASAGPLLEPSWLASALPVPPRLASFALCPPESLLGVAEPVDPAPSLSPCPVAPASVPLCAPDEPPVPNPSLGLDVLQPTPKRTARTISFGNAECLRQWGSINRLAMELLGVHGDVGARSSDCGRGT